MGKRSTADGGLNPSLVKGLPPDAKNCPAPMDIDLSDELVHIAIFPLKKERVAADSQGFQ